MAERRNSSRKVISKEKKRSKGTRITSDAETSEFMVKDYKKVESSKMKVYSELANRTEKKQFFL